MTTDDHTFSTTSTTGTVDRRRRTFVVAAFVLVVIAVVATVLGVVLSNNNSTESSSASSVDNGIPTTFITGPPTPQPTPAPPTTMPSTSPSLSPTTPGASRSPSGSPSTMAPVTDAPVTMAPVTDAPVTMAPVTLKPTLPGETWMPSVSPVTTAPTLAPVTVAPISPTPVPTLAPTTLAPIPIVTIPPTLPPTLAPVLPPTESPVTPAPTFFSPVLSQVEEVIRGVAIFGGSEFDDPTSYQSKALQWLQGEQQQQRQFSSNLVQRYALACIYYATHAVSHQYIVLDSAGGVALPWKDSTGWLSSASECTWFRVTCDGNGAVEALELSENRLTGSFPREATLLSSLQRLDLFDNSLFNDGDAGNAWLGDLSEELQYLFYGSNYFSYNGIPTQISKLTNLIEYDCSYTLYYGPLQGDSFAGLDNLEYLAMGYNVYDSTLPSELVNLPSLEFLYIQDADVTGSLNFMSDMSLLFEFWFDFNRISGTIPSSLPATLGSLSATDNSLTGSIPATMGSLTLMKQLWLYDNNLTGSVPSQLGNLKSLETLFLYGNDLLGWMPLQICDLRSSGDLNTLVIDCEGLVCSCCTGCVPI